MTVKVNNHLGFGLVASGFIYIILLLVIGVPDLYFNYDDENQAHLVFKFTGASSIEAVTFAGTLFFIFILAYVFFLYVIKKSLKFYEIKEYWIESNITRYVYVYIFWLMLCISYITAILVFINISNPALIEIIKSLFINNYFSPKTHMEIRLATSFLPVWLQAVFEFARRFAIPYCLIEIFFCNRIYYHRRLVILLVVGMALFFALITVDRFIAVLYFSAPILATILRDKKSAFKNIYLYLNIVGIIFSVVLLKHIQYGEIWSNEHMNNIKWNKVYYNGETKIIAKSSHIISSQESNPTKPSQESHPTKPSQESHPTKPSQESHLTKQGGEYVLHSIVSIVGRVFISPIQMINYAMESYNDTNFLHWNSTRFLSLFGISKNISSLEIGYKKYNDSFPVTFIGDLWRNGGYKYVYAYGIMLGLSYALVDYFLFTLASALSLRIISLLGSTILFYGNALSSSMITMVFGSLFLSIFIYILNYRMGKNLSI